ncbi:MAG: HNH endonuclease [Prevotellaceae bacterium]|nr:HNH endonuclease [Candidatus Minthosoma caballi]
MYWRASVISFLYLCNVIVYYAVLAAKYAQQTEGAKAAGHSNCPFCATSDNSNKTRIWKLAEMDADHVTAWSKGGATNLSNCQMLCKTHNRMKGNR